jgi:citrate synthase
MIDGRHGVLLHRGYPVEQLASQCSYLEVARLILEGELPTRSQLDSWEMGIMDHAPLHEATQRLVEGFPPGSNPLAVVVSAVASMSSLYPDGRNVEERTVRRRQIVRILGTMPAIVAHAYRHTRGFSRVDPDRSLGYCFNLMNMMFGESKATCRPNRILEKALEVLFILQADHEQNCSTNTMRGVGSSRADPYLCTAAAIAAFSGPLHGGANAEVVRMLREIGSKQRVSEFLRRVKAGEAALLGFGHRVYTTQDPRARMIKQLAEDVLPRAENSLFDLANELERIVMEDDDFASQQLHPNIELYSGMIYEAMGLPMEMLPVIICIPRASGWLAHWNEMLEDPRQILARPRQVYIGMDRREVRSIGQRP